MATLVPSFFDGSSSFYQVTRTTLKPWISFILGKIPLLTMKLADLDGT